MRTGNAHMELLRAVKNRKSVGNFGYGIGLASNYLDSIQPCLDDPDCFNRMMKGVTPGMWENAVKRAKTILTYSEEEQEEYKKAVATSTTAMKTILSQIKGGAVSLPKHCAMVFSNYVTTNKEDRDRDIMHPEGAEVDVKMPLLWQHLQPQPIGKYLGTIEQNNMFLKGVSCICDINELSGDCVKLVEAEILRISHGFKPKKFEALNSSPGDQVPAGFKVTSFEVVEESLVSVPANSGAIIDAWSSMLGKKQFSSELVKSFGQKFYNIRDTANQFPSAAIPSGSGEINIKVTVEQPGTAKSADTGCGCSIKNKSTSVANRPQADLQGDANPGVSSKPNPGMNDEDEDDTDNDEEMSEGKKGSKKKCPKCSGEMDDSGTCKNGKCGYVSGKSTDPVAASILAALGLSGKNYEIRFDRTIDTRIKSIKSGSIDREHTGEQIVGLHLIPKGATPRLDMPKTTKLYANITGSFEWVREGLAKNLRKFMNQKSIVGEVEFNDSSPSYDYARIEATMSDSVIIEVSGREGSRFYKASYSISDNTPVFSGDLSEVMATAVISEPEEKSEAIIETKNFSVDGSSDVIDRVISAVENIDATGNDSHRILTKQIKSDLSLLGEMRLRSTVEKPSTLKQLANDFALAMVRANESDLNLIKNIATLAVKSRDELVTKIEERQLECELSEVVG